MTTQRVAATGAGVALALGTETAVATAACVPTSNQVAGPIAGVLVRAEVVVTGAAAATTCTVKIRRGAGVAGADILPSDVVASVDAAATDRTVIASAVDTAAAFNAANGIYTVTATAAGAAQTARLGTIELQPTDFGV
jgi:hypothetical protein